MWGMQWLLRVGQFSNESFVPSDYCWHVLCVSFMTWLTLSTIRTLDSSCLLGCNIGCLFWVPLRWHHNGHDIVSNHQPHDCLLNCLFRRRSNKTSKPRVTGLCAGNSPGTTELPAEMASKAGNVSIWWRHHDKMRSMFYYVIAKWYTI